MDSQGEKPYDYWAAAMADDDEDEQDVAFASEDGVEVYRPVGAALIVTAALVGGAALMALVYLLLWM